jgi:hypothetical protein
MLQLQQFRLPAAPQQQQHHPQHTHQQIDLVGGPLVLAPAHATEFHQQQQQQTAKVLLPPTLLHQLPLLAVGLFGAGLPLLLLLGLEVQQAASWGHAQ